MKLKNILKISAVAMASVAILAACSSGKSSSNSEKEKVIFGTVGTTRPFSYSEKKGELTGYDIEVAKAVFKDSDKYEVEFKKSEWSSLFTSVQQGKFQMAGNNISYNEERKNFLYSNPIAKNPLVLAVNKDSGINSINDITGKSTQVVAGTSTASMLEDYNKKNSNDQTKVNYTKEDISQMLSNVNNGKYDYKIFETQSVKSIIKEQNLKDIKLIDFDTKDIGADINDSVYFVFGNDQKDLQDFVNKRLVELQKDGTLAKLSKKYLGKEDYAPVADEMKVPTK